MSLIDKIDDNDGDIDRFIVEFGAQPLIITENTVGYTVVLSINVILGDTWSPANKNFFCFR